jgi:hypothetical protein
MPESALLRHVRALAKRYGWLLYHTHDSRNSEAGFPDCVLTNGTRVFWVELKSATGKMTEEQALWIEMLRHAGQEVFIWRPADRPNIEALLRGGAQ